MLRIGARAKINWTLDITGRRADGYHLMDMLMQSVTLADEITLEKTLDGEITLTTAARRCSRRTSIIWRCGRHGRCKRQQAVRWERAFMSRSTFPLGRAWAAAAATRQACWWG